MNALCSRGLLFGLLLFTAACGGGDEPASDAVDSMATAHQHDTPDATVLVQEPMIPVEARSVQYATTDNESIVGYLAAPTRPDSVVAARGRDTTQALPAIVLVHEWWGLNDNIQGMARRLAGEGFRVLAVDLYGGSVAETPDAARALVEQATSDPEMTRQNLSAALAYLREQHHAEAIGVMGWCFGGRVTLETALAFSDQLDAAVMYYGNPEVDDEMLARLDVPLLGIFGGADESIPTATVQTFEEKLQSLGKDAEIIVYEGAGHAFANPSGQNYQADAARRAWDRTITFLNEHLWP